MLNLSGQLAIVTGGSRGIGAAIAMKLARGGADIVVNYTASSGKAEEVASEIRALGRRAFVVQCDVSDESSVASMFDAVAEEFGKSADILVNNAGITKDMLLSRMSLEDYKAVLDVNLAGAFLCSKYAIKTMMRARSGAIVNISSVVGFTGNAGQANYCSAKAGIIGLTKSLAHEYAKRGIRVNAVAPGFIASDMTNELNDTIKDKLVSQIPLGAMGEPDDIANAVLFLASPLASYVTGETVHVNGGLLMS